MDKHSRDNLEKAKWTRHLTQDGLSEQKNMATRLLCAAQPENAETSPKPPLEVQPPDSHVSDGVQRPENWQSSVQSIDLFPAERNLREFIRDNNKYRKMASRFEFARDLYSAWESLKEPHRVGRLADIIQSARFESCIFAVIFVNCAYTVVATNWDMAHWNEARPLGMQITEVTFLCLYALELILKLVVHGCYFFCNTEATWNVFDLCLVLIDLLDHILSLYNQQGYSIAFGRTIRVLKVARVLRFVRMIHFLSELRLMLNCLMGSVFSLMWSFALLTLLKLMFAIALVQQMANLLSSSKTELSHDERRIIMDFFGSIEQTVLTLFMAISGGIDWAVAYDVVKLSGRIGSFIFLTYICFMLLAVTNIITSIFMQKAMKQAKPDVEDTMLETCQENLEAVQDLKELFNSIDVDSSSSLTLEEFRETLKNVLVQEYFLMKGLNVSHVDMFFSLLASASPSGNIDVNTFVTGCLRMKGYATNVDVMSVDYRLQVLSSDIMTFMKECQRDIKKLYRAFAASGIERL